MLRVENLSFSYNEDKYILKNLSFSIKKGEFTAIIGQNGSGKTTLLKQLNGLLRPSQGRIFIDGSDISSIRTSVLARSIGFLFQNPDHQIFCSTVYEEIAFGLKNMKLGKDNVDRLVREAAAMVSISEYLDSSPFNLSKGQRQRVALASVLAMETDILVLDEPTTGQDYREGMEIMNIVLNLNKKGKTIIIVTHDMELVSRYARRTIILKDGQILEDGHTRAVLAKKESLAASNLQPPQVYSLAEMFKKQGLFEDACTVEEMFCEIMDYLEGEKNVRIN